MKNAKFFNLDSHYYVLKDNQLFHVSKERFILCESLRHFELFFKRYFDKQLTINKHDLDLIAWQSKELLDVLRFELVSFRLRLGTDYEDYLKLTSVWGDIYLRSINRKELKEIKHHQYMKRLDLKIINLLEELERAKLSVDLDIIDNAPKIVHQVKPIVQIEAPPIEDDDDFSFNGLIDLDDLMGIEI